MNDVDCELALAEALEFERMLHTLTDRQAMDTRAAHVRRRLILACFEVR
ncbi:MAG TPA: hypothetical protein VNC41_19365 [Acidimicrobiia bacterium]|nr:hypothetical protein [Acidimicrobiia bacterium]